MNSDNTGFNAAEIIISIAVVAVIGVLTYVLLGNSTEVEQSTETVSSQTEAEKVKDEKLEEAELVVRDAYNTYLSEQYRDEPDQERALEVFNQQTTAELATKLSQSEAADPVLCSQNIPERLEFKDGELSGGIAMFTVVGYYAESDNEIQVSVDTRSMKLADVICS